MASDPYYSDDSVSSSETEFSDEEANQSIIPQSLSTYLVTKSIRFVPGDESGRYPSEMPPGFRFSENQWLSKSREAAGIWRTGYDYCWKIYRHIDAMEKARDDIEIADEADLPMVPIVPIVRGESMSSGDVFVPSTATSKNTWGFAIRTRYLGAPNILFSGQEKGRGPANFKTEMGKIRNRTILLRILQGLQVAVNISLSDPQGFFNPYTGQIQFMDIHIGSSSAAITLRNAVNTRLGQLPP